AKEWRLVDDIIKPAQFEEGVKKRAAELAATSDRPADGKGVALTPLKREDAADSITYQYVQVVIDRELRTATLTVKSPLADVPTDIAGIEAQGAAWWPLQMARELDDAILQLRTNDLDVGTWVLKTEGDSALVLAADE